MAIATGPLSHPTYGNSGAAGNIHAGRSIRSARLTGTIPCPVIAESWALNRKCLGTLGSTHMPEYLHELCSNLNTFIHLRICALINKLYKLLWKTLKSIGQLPTSFRKLPNRFQRLPRQLVQSIYQCTNT